MSRYHLALASLVTVAAIAACSTSDKDSGAGGHDTTATGLPCDVAKVLEAKCTSCHSDPPAVGALMALVSYDDLVAPSVLYPEQTNAQRSIVRMSAMAGKMPPGVGGTPDEVAVLQQWVDDGMPRGSCDPLVTPDPAFTGASVCTSGVISKSGDHPPNRYDMYPGRACNACHKKGEGGEIIKTFQVAGTVYPTGHEPDDCLGIDGVALSDVVVEVTGADGQVFTIHPRKSGNFTLSNSGFKVPYTARVISATGQRVMSAPQTEGDCNLCHTDAGTSSMGSGTAPGRIVVP